MTAGQKHTGENSWDQSGLEKLKATWPFWRRRKDKKALKKAFAQAADVPLAAEALAWAEQYGVKFFVDRQAVNIGGYYIPGTGIVAVTSSTLEHIESLANLLAHEIRHAWQDYQGLLARDEQVYLEQSFADRFINTALTEADANAFGKLAQAQARILQVKENIKKLGTKEEETRYLEALKKNTGSESAKLRKEFLKWFSEDQSHTGFYGDAASKSYGKRWDIYLGDVPLRNFEFKSADSYEGFGMDIHDRQDVLRLGESFSGTQNYLTALQPDILPKQILRPSLANTFWGVANSEQIKLTTDLRKAYLKKKLAPENRKPRHPWP